MDTAGLDLVDAEGGCRLKVRVKPSAKQDTLIGPHGGRIKMTVVAPPERGKANESVARVLAGALNLATSRVRVVLGFGTQDKTVFVEGCGSEEVRRRLERMPRVSTGAQRP
ncbi:MAG TPA: DUF167 domain-containing protein [Candidatus Polarisedimenticolia bacterium]|nr:DUF167 domain-containing protein [Candidatus Polarisedimenticolia bacterium]